MARKPLMINVVQIETAELGPRSRLMPASTASSCCAPTPKSAALQVVLRYRNLLAVEDAFKTAKALLATRPIFHKTDAGIRGHVFCTLLALAQVPQFRFERR